MSGECRARRTQQIASKYYSANMNPLSKDLNEDHLRQIPTKDDLQTKTTPDQRDFESKLLDSRSEAEEDNKPIGGSTQISLPIILKDKSSFRKFESPQMEANEYDFVIVGGGTSGLVVANRLSEDPNVQVLVIEAGGDHTNNDSIKIPILHEGLKGSEVDWNFKSLPQVVFDQKSLNLQTDQVQQSALCDRKFPLSQGRALGGSSAISAHVFVPPSKTLIDAWEKLGNPGWNWDTLKSYFERVYSLQTLDAQQREDLGIKWTHEQDATPSGPIKISHSGKKGDPVSQAWISMLKSNGFEMSEDPFSGKSLGAFRCLASIDPNVGERSYAATAYYMPAKNRPNLRVLTDAMVEKVLLEKENEQFRATGVRFRQDGSILIAKARKEVILAAGTFQSPKILELSGVGNAKLLCSLGIDMLIDNPNVGENLQDHVMCSMKFQAKDDIDIPTRNLSEILESGRDEYEKNRTGPLASVAAPSYAYLPMMKLLGVQGQKEFRSVLGDYSFNPWHPKVKLYHDIAKSIFTSEDEGSGCFLIVPRRNRDPTDIDLYSGRALDDKFITIAATLSLPMSRGSVHIASSEPTKDPLIDPRYLSHSVDVNLLVRQVRCLEAMAVLKPFGSLLKPFGTKMRRIIKRELTKKEKRQVKRGEITIKENIVDAAEEYVRENSVPMWHPTSTCTMLPKEDGGVVDSQLIVYGTSNLRVVDASIMPLIPRTNPQSTVYAVAERAADLIKGV